MSNRISIGILGIWLPLLRQAKMRTCECMRVRACVCTANVRTLKLICICGLQSVSLVVTHSQPLLPGPLQKSHFTQWDIFCEIRSILFSLCFSFYFRFSFRIEKKNENQILPARYQFNLLYDLKGSSRRRLRRQ